MYKLFFPSQDIKRYRIFNEQKVIEIIIHII